MTPTGRVSVGGHSVIPQPLQSSQKEQSNNMGTWIAIAVGGAIGSMARHGVNHLVHARWLTTRFPAGTVIVNLAGCFVIGLLAGLLASHRIALRFYWREFVFVGVLGGFTTFSTFGLDTLLLARTHSSVAAVINVGVQMLGGLSAVWLGYAIGVRE
jgi:CrcB protein